MQFKIRTFENERKFDDYLGDRDFDSCGFSAETMPSPMGYHAYAITGATDDIDMLEKWVRKYAAGCWLTYRFQASTTKDVLCIEFP